MVAPLGAKANAVPSCDSLLQSDQRIRCAVTFFDNSANLPASPTRSLNSGTAINGSKHPGSNQAKRQQLIHQWHKSLLHEIVPPLIRKWERKLNVEVTGYFLQRMKNKWGSCNSKAGHIRINTELVKKPKDLLEYVIVHEMAHLLEPNHNDRFIAILKKHYPTWREARAELNELPLAAEVWKG